MVPVWAPLCQASGPSRLAQGQAGGGPPHADKQGPVDSGRVGPSSAPFLSDAYLHRGVFWSCGEATRLKSAQSPASPLSQPGVGPHSWVISRGKEGAVTQDALWDAQ